MVLMRKVKMQNGEEAYGSRHRFKSNIMVEFDIPKYRMLSMFQTQLFDH